MKRTDKQHRRDSKLTRNSGGAADNVVFGISPVLEALRSERRRVERVMTAENAREKRIAEIIDVCRSKGIAFSTLPASKLSQFVPPDARHQGVVAVTSSASYADAEDVLAGAGTPPLFVVLDGIEDPRNLGAIIRTAECAGADGVFIPERRAVGLTGTVAKSSAGALEHIPVAKAGNLNRFIEELRSKNIWVVGAAGEAQLEYTEWDWTQPTAIVLGAEGSGLHRLVAENCDALVRIPMYGRIDSLNVSVAAGVILFEAQRQRSV